MQNNPFSQPGQFWRGNLHTHCTTSDGRKSAEETCRLYKEAGYDFVALTDHFMAQFGFKITDSTPYRTDDFTTLIGAELHQGTAEFGQKWHIVALGLPLDFAKPTADEDGPQIVQRALDHGAFVAAAHPNRMNYTEQDILSLGPIHAIEVYNGASADHNDRADSWYLFDILTAHGHRYSACAGDDCHFKPGNRDFAVSWVYVKSESLNPDALLEALKNGYYYSSTGPQIHDISVQGRTVKVRCSPAERVFITGYTDLYKVTGSPAMTEAQFQLHNFKSDYFRVIVRDHNGNMAWSNPMWFN